jgi:amino acid adenylation domain-containing protein
LTQRPDLVQRRSQLSPARQALFEEWSRGLSPDASGSARIPRRTPEDSVLLSFAQERQWFLHELEPDSPAYNIARAYRLSGALDLPALEQSLNEISRRHEALRTTFSVVGGEPVQVIAAEQTLQLPLLDLRSLPDSEREAEARRLCVERAQLPFDLSHGPLFRPALLKLGAEEHILLLSMHHIVSDGWSMGVLLRELSALYRAFAEGKPAPLPDLPIQYADYALWQRQWLQGERLEAQIAYWKGQLADAPQVLDLPTDHPRPQTATYEGAVQTAMLPRALTEALQELAQEEGATLFMVLLAAFQTLLHRYSGEVDIVVGSPIANRTQAEIEPLIGFFVNTLALRTDLSGNPTFRQLLDRVRTACLGAYDHQVLPFEKLVQELGVPRDLDYPPLFQTLFVFQNAPAPALQLPGLAADRMDTSVGALQYDLNLVQEVGHDGLRVRLGYKTALFEAATMQRLLGHYQTLLEGIVTSAEQRVAELPLLTPAEQRQILVAWNDTQKDYPLHLCSHQLFERQVDLRPNAVAVEFRDQHLTYGQLNSLANQLAHHLRSLGAKPEMMVGLCAEHSLALAVGFLAIQKAGAAVVLLDPALPKDRLSFILDDAGMSLVLTTAEAGHRLPESAAHILDLDALQDTLARQNDQNPDSGVISANLAYMIYTSGSTGIPKGVMVGHRALSNFSLALMEAVDVGPGTRRLHNGALSYDVAVGNLVGPLCAGAVLHLASAETRLPGPKLIRLIQEKGITHLGIVPSALRMLPVEELPSLQALILGGEAVPADLVARWAPGYRVFNGYGPAEAAINTTLYECIDDGQAPPIGRPMANYQVYLLDSSLQPVPVGISGELCIGGLGLARGYLNQTSLTAEKFIPDPFGSEQGARLYRSGDLARYRPDGNIEFLGRIDHQVKIRGSRVELGEIEVVLRQHPAVREAVVVTTETAQGDRRLVAYVVSTQEPDPTPGALRRFLREKLPEQMLPSATLYLDALPLTPSGKIDRLSLPDPKWSRAETVQAYVPPSTPIEEALAAVWAQVLDVERIGVDDNFFDLGGHSLLAAQIVYRVRDVLQVEVPLRLIFDSPTLAGMAAFIAKQQTRVATDDELDQTMAALEHMPDEEVEQLLSDEGSEREQNQR